MTAQDLAHDFSRLMELPPEMFPLLLITAGAVIFVFAFRHLALRFILPRLGSSASRIKWRRNSAYLAFCILVLLLFPLWLPSLRTVAAFLGIFGAGVILVLKEVIVNVAGWFFIVFRRPFEIGNRITIGAYSGDVLDIRIMDTSLIEVSSRDEGGQSTGRVVHVPNSLVFTVPLANASKEFAFNWNEIRIPISPESDWKRASLLVEKTAAEVVEPISEKDSRIRKSDHEYAIRYQRITPKVYVEFKHGVILLTLRHLVEPRTNRLVSDRFWRILLERFQKEKRIHLHAPMPH